MPVLAKLHADGKYRVVGVSLDPPSATQAVKDLWAKKSWGFETHTISPQQAGRLFDLERMGIPLTVVFDADGKITKIHQGRLREGDL